MANNVQNPLELNPTVGGKQYAAGISKSKMQSLVDEVNKVGDKYEKPAGGIPSSDLSSAVQGSLAKADESAGEQYVIDEINGVYDYLYDTYGDPNRLNQLEDWGNIADEATLRSRLRNVSDLSQAHTQRISFTVGGKTGFAIVTYNGEEFYVEYTLGSNRYACKQDSNQSGGWTPWQGSTELETYEHLTNLDTRCNEQEADILALDERKADVEGSYESMAVGSAKTLEANTLTAVDFTKRVVPSSVGSGASKLSLLKGNTLVWNQMADSQAELVIKGSIKSDGYIGTILPWYMTAKHVYYIKAKFNTESVEGISFFSIVPTNSATDGIIKEDSSVGEVYVKGIKTAPNNTGQKYCSFRVLGNTGTIVDVLVNNIQIIDLTRMFGAGNEPSSVEEFEALFPRENYAYNTGWLMNFQGHTLKSTGFNVWDEELEKGSINGKTGANVSANATRSKNFISIFPGQTYYMFAPANNPFLYDAQKNYIGRYGRYVTNDTFVPPSNAYYMRFALGTDYGTTYKHDICINISDPSKNGTYMPYMEDTFPLNVTTLKGKAEGSDTEVVMFPDGLKKAGSVYDEIDYKNGIAIKRVGGVDLGTLNWVSRGDTAPNSFVSETLGFNSTSIPNSICLSYMRGIRGGYETLDNNALDKTYNYSTNSKIYIKDSNYTDSNTFKAAMNGVMLYYELATPIVYHFEPMNNVYRVEQGGTEEVLERDTLAPEGYNPLTAPMRADIRYGVDVVGILGNLKKDYVSKESIQVFLSALGTQMGGTWSMTWNETTERYDFVFTPNA